MARRVLQQGDTTTARTWDKVRKDVMDAGRVDVQDAEKARKELHDAVRAQRLADVGDTTITVH